MICWVSLLVLGLVVIVCNSISAERGTVPTSVISAFRKIDCFKFEARWCYIVSPRLAE